MDKQKVKQSALARRQRRVRGKVSGSAARPRLRITRTNLHIYAQVIDDVSGATVASASSVDAELKGSVKNGSTAEAATKVGELVGKRAIDAGVSEVVFDRGGRLYHGRVKALADGARSAGLKF
jgi:large subunit ribosomal protein L18